MVRLTDADCKALEILGEPIITREQINAVLDIFSLQSEYVQDRVYKSGSLDKVSFVVNSYVDNKVVLLASITGLTDDAIHAITNMFLWSSTHRLLNVNVTVGHDDYDYQIAFDSADKTIFGGFFFRLSRTPFEIVD
jgi:hypothetical protein